MRLFIRRGKYCVDFTCPVTHGRRRKCTEVRAHGAGDDEGAAKARAMEVAKRLVEAPQEVSKRAARERPGTLGFILRRTYEEHWSTMPYGAQVRHQVNLLCREMGGRRLDAVTYKLLREHAVVWIADGTAPSTVNRRIAAISVALREAHLREEVRKIPAKFPHYSEKRYTRERYMTEDEERLALGWLEQRAIEDDAAKRENWIYVRHLMVFLLDTGFRFGESFKFTLERGHADLAHGCTKTTIGRRIPLTRRALAAAEYLLRSPIHEKLNRSTTGSRPKVSWDWCSWRWERCMIAIGANTGEPKEKNKLTLHILRHTCASRLVQRGIDLYRVQKWMGHNCINVTQRYAKLAPGMFAEAVALLEQPPGDSRES